MCLPLATSWRYQVSACSVHCLRCPAGQVLAGRGYQMLQVCYVLTSFWFILAASLDCICDVSSDCATVLKAVSAHASRCNLVRYNWYFLHGEFEVKSEDKTFACWYSNFWPQAYMPSAFLHCADKLRLQLRLMCNSQHSDVHRFAMQFTYLGWPLIRQNAGAICCGCT